MSNQLNEAASPVLVYGATGAQARPVAESLLARGRAVRVLTRDPGRASGLRRAGAEVVVGDLDDPQSLARASAGVSAVFLIVPFFGGTAQQGRNAIVAARDAGTSLIVWNPTGEIPVSATGNPGIDVRAEILSTLESSGVPFIAVPPTAYMENFLQPAIIAELAASGVFAYPIPTGAAMQWMSHRDAAEFAVAALDRPRLANRVIPVAGPQRLTGEDIAAAFGRGLEREVRFRQMPPREFARVIGGDFGPAAEEAIAAAYEGMFADPSVATSEVDFDAVLAALPIEPTTLEAWVRERSALFA